MNLGDPELELVDPTPNIHSLFLHFDKIFFWTKLASRAVVRWSKRMYSCAGICSYDRGGLCDIALSEPLLKLRPRKDLVETLLHEMIHAYLFITNRDRDRDGHGPNFKAHMHRINQAAGLNISIYHDFHEEVQLYQTHWWRCNGPCQNRKPHFGIVRRTNNRAPGPMEYWWEDHKRKCGGNFIKIKEPQKENKKQEKKRTSPKPCGDITKYINNNKSNKGISKPVLKDSNKAPINTNFVKNSSSTIVVTKRNNVVFNPQAVKTSNVFTGKGEATGKGSSTDISDITETVRSIWANKVIPTVNNNISNNKVNKPNAQKNSNKHKANTALPNSPPHKVKKIDDYFKTSATSILKDIYGQDFEIKEQKNNKRLSIVAVEPDLVDCPICCSKISSTEINKHLDECLNKDVIKSICNETEPVLYVKSEVVKEEISRIPKIKTEIYDSIDTHINANVNTATNNCVQMQVKNNDDNKLLAVKKEAPTVKIEPGTSKESDSKQKCPCCDKVVDNMSDHLDECLTFFDNDATIPIEGASTSFANDIIVIDDEEDILHESLVLNATGTKLPCPCCMTMVEHAEMNDHLDLCLSK